MQGSRVESNCTNPVQSWANPVQRWAASRRRPAAAFVFLPLQQSLIIQHCLQQCLMMKNCLQQCNTLVTISTMHWDCFFTLVWSNNSVKWKSEKPHFNGNGIYVASEVFWTLRCKVLCLDIWAWFALHSVQSKLHCLVCIAHCTAWNVQCQRALRTRIACAVNLQCCPTHPPRFCSRRRDASSSSHWQWQRYTVCLLYTKTKYTRAPPRPPFQF